MGEGTLVFMLGDMAGSKEYLWIEYLAYRSKAFYRGER